MVVWEHAKSAACLHPLQAQMSSFQSGLAPRHLHFCWLPTQFQTVAEAEAIVMGVEQNSDITEKVKVAEGAWIKGTEKEAEEEEDGQPGTEWCKPT